MSLHRRPLLALPALLGAAALRPARAADPFRVGFVYVSPIGDAGWTFQHELGRRAVEAALGPAVKTAYVENVPEGADAERVIRRLAQDGNQMVFATSFGYMNPVEKVARAFPKAKFEHATGYKRAANLATYSGRYYEPRYLTGIIAGRLSKSGTIGYVAAFPIPEVIQGINAMLLGARSVNPKAVIKVVFTSSWFDPGKERAAADTLVAQGADYLTQHTDSTAVVQAAEEKGVWCSGYDSDMLKYAPKTHTTAVEMHWDDYYIDRVRKAIDGGWTSGDVWGGLASGMVKLSRFNPALPAPLLAEVAAQTEAIKSGRLVVFSGPLRDQSGAVKLPEGKALTDPEILSMNWFLEGVQGKL
ncbi:BMP family ABC transporter substrate-binding protein [Roseicella frigidaeris]|uniref:BMP family ABC transporter substrate-binding protein n=1 Tax=Roseicella frigidaeris TaxID=2230885 RepID=A0A327MG78_9PROT|nr:BMP family ABC transporter substrate-binding protein [Roseicella frigidaeris]RAI61044.1 BMP family ABC transporter substrate-binding protein [Roseicella frigidaeris]